jgi:hypothetical protein
MLSSTTMKIGTGEQTRPMRNSHSIHDSITQELNNAMREWADLGPLESFLKCDIIAGKIASLRTAISDFCGISHVRKFLFSARVQLMASIGR